MSRAIRPVCARNYVNTNSDTVDLYRAALHWRPRRIPQGKKQNFPHHVGCIRRHIDTMQHQPHFFPARGGLCHGISPRFLCIPPDQIQKIHAQRNDVHHHPRRAHFETHPSAVRNNIVTNVPANRNAGCVPHSFVPIREIRVSFLIFHF
jgi:hypothetical protein